MIENPAFASLWFLIFAAPICFWVAWSDMAHMKIPNKAVVALVICFAIIGIFVLPFDVYAWRWVHLILILTIGFLMNMVGLIGAGDAKFAAAAAPFIAYGDLLNIAVLFATLLLAAFISHRAMRAFPPFRNAVPDWASWQRGDFPMGLALGATLACYLAIAARFGA